MTRLKFIFKVYCYKLLRLLIPKPTAGFRNVLIVRFGGVNQGILGLGYILPLFEANPLLNISVLGDSLSLKFLKNCIELKTYAVDELEGKNTLEKINLFSKKHSFDAIYLAHPFGDKNLLKYLRMHFKCPIIGFHLDKTDTDVDHTLFLQNQHIIEENLIALEPIFNTKLPRKNIQVRYPFFYKNKLPFDPNSYHIGLFPLSKSCLDEAKLYKFFDKFMKFCYEVQPRTKFHLFGNKEFVELFTQLRMDRDWVENHIELSSWDDISVLMNRMDFFIGFDSPFLELANAHRIPHVVMDDVASGGKFMYEPWLNECYFRRVSVDRELDPAFSPLVEAWSTYHKTAGEIISKLDHGKLLNESMTTKEI